MTRARKESGKEKQLASEQPQVDIELAIQIIVALIDDFDNMKPERIQYWLKQLLETLGGKDARAVSFNAGSMLRLMRILIGLLEGFGLATVKDGVATFAVKVPDAKAAGFNEPENDPEV